jgi:hypothetical protein
MRPLQPEVEDHASSLRLAALRRVLPRGGQRGEAVETALPGIREACDDLRDEFPHAVHLSPSDGDALGGVRRLRSGRDQGLQQFGEYGLEVARLRELQGRLGRNAINLTHEVGDLP